MSSDSNRRDNAALPSNVAQLRQSLADLIGESQALRTDVHAAEAARRASERAQKRASRLSLGVLMLLGIFVALLLVVTWQNNQLAQRVNQTNSRMADCTTPGGKCYEEGGKRTGKAISDIIRAEVFMAECARLYPGEVGPTFDRKLEACVTQRLAGQSLMPQPSPSSTPTPPPSASPHP